MRKIEISEHYFSTQIEDLLDTYHWVWIHFRPARIIKDGEESWRTAVSGYKGFPDYVAIRPNDDGKCRLLFIELKGEKGKLNENQLEWAELLSACSEVEYHLWRPSDFETALEMLK